MIEEAPNHLAAWRFRADGSGILDRQREARVALQERLRGVGRNAVERARSPAAGILPGEGEGLPDSLGKAGMPE